MWVERDFFVYGLHVFLRQIGLDVGGEENVGGDEADILACFLGDVIVQGAQDVLALAVGILEDDGGGQAVFQKFRRRAEQVGGDDGQVQVSSSADALTGDGRAGRRHINAAKIGVFG